MTWTKRLSQLNDVLGDLVPFKEGIPKFVKAAGLKPAMIDSHGSALDIWCNVIDEARKNDKVIELIKGVLDKYPDNPFLLSALEEEEIDYSLSPKLKKDNWREVKKDTLEKLTLGINTLLPISFLSKGITSSKSVAKIEIKRGKVKEVGTGFLFKIDNFNDLFFMTNHHVLKKKELLPITKVIFDFEEDIHGDSKASRSYIIDPEGPWYSSPAPALDVTICKLKEDSELEEFGFLHLKEVTISRNDFVNIIQHPGGQFKQIALYHNIVTNTTDRVIQYLTATMKGSSGAPVFNSEWDVVALHHSGGEPKEKEPELPQIKYRNEGISINCIINFLIEKHEPNEK